MKLTGLDSVRPDETKCILCADGAIDATFAKDHAGRADDDGLDAVKRRKGCVV